MLDFDTYGILEEYCEENFIKQENNGYAKCWSSRSSVGR